MATDLEDFEDLYPDVEYRGEARPRRAKRPLPTVDTPAVYPLGWGARMAYPDGSSDWITPSGTSQHPFWWARRQSAERLGAAYEKLHGGAAEIHHATRRRTCTSAAKNPWEPGYRASVDGPQCGASIETQVVPSLLAAALAKRAEKLVQKERAYAARRDAADRKKQAAARKKSYHFAPGMAGDVAAVRYLLRHGLGDDESYGARAHLVQRLPTGADLLDEDGSLDTNALKEFGCQLAADLAHSDLPKARALARDLGVGRCVRAEEVIAKTAAVRSGLRERAAKRDATARANARAGDREAAKRAKAEAREAAKRAKAEAREAARLAKAAKAAPPTIAENMARADAERAAEMQRREAHAAKVRALREAREAKEAEAKAAKAARAAAREAAKAAKAAKRQAEANDLERAQRAREREAQREADAAAARAAGLARGREAQAAKRREEFAEKQPRLAPRAPRQRVF